MLFLDIKPPAPVGDVAGLVLLAIVVLILVAILIVGFVFLLKFLQRRKVNALSTSGGSLVQPSSPNQ